METALIILGFALLNVILAYVPIILVVAYNMRDKPPPEDELLHAYVVEDKISTEQAIAQLEERYDEQKHIPLT